MQGIPITRYSKLSDFCYMKMPLSKGMCVRFGDSIVAVLLGVVLGSYTEVTYNILRTLTAG